MQTKMARKPGVDVNALISAVKDNPALGDLWESELDGNENIGQFPLKGKKEINNTLLSNTMFLLLL
jgi:hypothetical protein